MKLRAGFKLTEAGPLPLDWDAKAVKEIATVRGGKRLPKGIALLTQPTPHPYIRVTDMRRGGVDVSDIRFVPAEAFAAIKNYRIRTSDIFISVAGTLGLVRKIPKSLDGANLTENADMITEIRCNQDFLLYWLMSDPIQSIIEAEKTVGAQPKLALGRIENFKIGVPPTSVEQHEIATALGDVDALLASLQKLIAKKRDFKQAAMQELLTGKTRLQGFPRNEAIVSDELGSRPKSWPLFRLKDLVDPSRTIRYGIVQPGTYDSAGRYMIRGQDYSAAKGWAAPNEVFRVSDLVERRYKNARVKGGDLIMTIVGYCGHVEIVPEWLDGANLTQTTARIAIQSTLASPAFCKYLLQSPIGKNQVNAFVKGAAQPGLNCGDVENFRLPLPSLSEQTSIAAALLDVDAEIAALESRRDKTAAIKQGMMQELLTGKTRLVPK